MEVLDSWFHRIRGWCFEAGWEFVAGYLCAAGCRLAVDCRPTVGSGAADYRPTAGCMPVVVADTLHSTGCMPAVGSGTCLDFTMFMAFDLYSTMPGTGWVAAGRTTIDRLA